MTFDNLHGCIIFAMSSSGDSVEDVSDEDDGFGPHHEWEIVDVPLDFYICMIRPMVVHLIQGNDVVPNLTMKYGGQGASGWHVEHKRVYNDYGRLLLGDYTVTCECCSHYMWVYVRMRNGYECSEFKSLRQIVHWHGFNSGDGIMSALMGDDTEVNANDMISRKGWVCRAIRKLQREFRIRRSFNFIRNRILPHEVEACDCVIRNIAEFMPVRTASSVILVDGVVGPIRRWYR